MIIDTQEGSLMDGKIFRERSILPAVGEGVSSVAHNVALVFREVKICLLPDSRGMEERAEVHRDTQS